MCGMSLDLFDWGKSYSFPSGEKSRTVIAQLCNTLRYESSRKLLQVVFCGGSSPKKAAANLTQAIRRLKNLTTSQLPALDLLRTDGLNFWLSCEMFDVLPRPPDNLCCLKSLDTFGESLWEWVRQGRSESL